MLNRASSSNNFDISIQYSRNKYIYILNRHSSTYIGKDVRQQSSGSQVAVYAQTLTLSNVNNNNCN